MKESPLASVPNAKKQATAASPLRAPVVRPRFWSGWLHVRPTRARKPDGYLLGAYRIATAPEPNSSRLTSFKSTCFESPANNVGPWPASPGCTTNSYSSINPSSVNASGGFTPPTNSPFPGSRLSCRTAASRSPRTSSAFQSTRSRVLDTTYFFAAPLPRTDLVQLRIQGAIAIEQPDHHGCSIPWATPASLKHIVDANELGPILGPMIHVGDIGKRLGDRDREGLTDFEAYDWKLLLF
jgi:hypothetical protein